MDTLDATDYPRNASWVLQMNDCGYVADVNEIFLSDFLRWNTGLPSDNCTLTVGYSYCVLNSDKTVLTTDTAEYTVPATTVGATTTAGATSTLAGTSTASSTTTSASAVPTHPGTISTCTTYHTVVEGDGCWAISNEYGITLDQFYEWNTEVGTDCSALLPGYAVCVGID